MSFMSAGHLLVVFFQQVPQLECVLSGVHYYHCLPLSAGGMVSPSCLFRSFRSFKAWRSVWVSVSFGGSASLRQRWTSSQGVLISLDFNENAFNTVRNHKILKSHSSYLSSSFTCTSHTIYSAPSYIGSSTQVVVH